MKRKEKSKNTAIIVAAGSGTRMGTDIKKQFIEINGIPVIVHALKAFEKCSAVDDVIVVTAQEDIYYMLDLVKSHRLSKVRDIAAGGSTRTKSVINGLKYAQNSDYVAIHDGARPCITADNIEKTLLAAQKHGAAFLGVKVTDTIKDVDQDGYVTKTVDRTPLWRVQTPQCFDVKIITEAYEKYGDLTLTDDCTAAEMLGVKVFAVEGSSSNIKITTKDDILIAQSLL